MDVAVFIRNICSYMNKYNAFIVHVKLYPVKNFLFEIQYNIFPKYLNVLFYLNNKLLAADLLFYRMLYNILCICVVKLVYSP